MSFLDILILSLGPGLAELLPLSSSAHAIPAERFLGLEPSTPDDAPACHAAHRNHVGSHRLLLARLAKDPFRITRSADRQWRVGRVRHLFSGAVGLVLLKLIKHVLVKRSLKLEVELPFGNTKLIACGLTVAGVLIMVSSRRASSASRRLSNMGAFWIGAVQGLCLPFRGFSRSGATISTSLLTRVERRRAEEFSVALAVVLTPAVVMREAMRFHKAYSAGLQGDGF